MPTIQNAHSLNETMTGRIHIDTSKIPDAARDYLSASTMELILNILRQPGGREALDARTAARKAATAAK